MARVLVIDDNAAAGEVLFQAVSSAGHAARCVDTFAEAERLLGEEAWDVVVADVNLDAGHTGLELLRPRNRRPDAPSFVFVTGEAEVETAVEALRAGAFDYLPKPVDLARLLLALEKALSARGRPAASPSRVGTDRLVGRTATMVEVFAAIGRASAVDSPVLIVGEPGVGKERVAREVHRHSPRSKGPFVVASAEDFREGELPADALRAARGGTLYLERIDALAPAAQARLARAIELRAPTKPGDEPPDARYIGAIAGTTEALASELRYVLSVIEVRIPPLRARRDDIPLLVEQTLSRLAPRVRRTLAVDAGAMSALQAYAWPGNVRELASVLERAAVRTPTGTLTETDLRDLLPSRGPMPAATARVAAPTPAVGSVPRFLGDRYVLDRLLRLTDMSETWEGRQPSLGRKVLVKFLASRDEHRIGRFEREGRIQATLRHPHIPTILEAGVDPGIPGRMFLAMEFVEGSLLDRYVENAAQRVDGGERVRLVLRLARQVALALDYLHGKGIVHRDVKPENVIVAEGEHAFLLDYGIARTISRDVALTAEMVIVGSVPYMSPEQFSGGLEMIDARSDVWGLGVTVYQLLTGVLPFDGLDLNEVASKARTQEPPPPSDADPSVPDAVDALVRRALAKRAVDRFQTAAEMAEALAAALG